MVLVFFFKEFGWTAEYCYTLTEMQIQEIVSNLGRPAKGQAGPTPPDTRPKLTLNDKVANKARRLGRKLTQAELLALL